MKIYICNLDKFIETKKGTLLTTALKENGFSIEMPCNGLGICGGCILNVRSLGNEYNFKPALSCFYLVEKDIEIEFLPVDEEVIQTSEESFDEKTTMKDSVSIAIDVGTTGISMEFIDNTTKSTFASKSFLNPQVNYGNDLISRIDFASKNTGNLFIVRNVLLDRIAEVMLETLDNHSLKNVKRVAISANTTMLHIINGVNPYSISVYPYTAPFLEKKVITKRDMHLPVSPDTEIILLPNVSSYIGSDVVSGLYVTDFYKRTDISIFIDVGTNGEIVLNKNGELYAVSTAAGPALEGMNIECGSRAVEGSIKGFSIKDNKFILTVVGKSSSIDAEVGFRKFDILFDKSECRGVSIKSICGSGLIDIVAELLNNDVILPSGNFNKNMPEKYRHFLVDKKFYLTSKVYISQKDIRQVQLAKSATSTGIKILLKDNDIGIEEVNEIIIAGSFGYYLKSSNVLTTGMIPKNYPHKISYAGNTSLKGAHAVCIDESALDNLSELSKKVNVSELSLREDFQDIFIREMKF